MSFYTQLGRVSQRERVKQKRHGSDVTSGFPCFVAHDACHATKDLINVPSNCQSLGDGRSEVFEDIQRRRCSKF
jgi:hypothetical protein